MAVLVVAVSPTEEDLWAVPARGRILSSSGSRENLRNYREEYVAFDLFC
jgi:hypothetical protein